MAGASDPELVRLLLEELSRHEDALGPGASAETQRKAVHAAKGSAGIAGEHSLYEALSRIERRFVTGDPSAVGDARAVVAAARAALAEGGPIVSSTWPEPPEDLVARPMDIAVGGRYVAEMQDRLYQLDRALAAEGDAQAVHREVHGMKSAALAASDEVTAWFCHGMEERLRLAERAPNELHRGVEEVARWRAVLGEMILAPDRALETLRLLARPARGSAGLPLIGHRAAPSRRAPFELEPRTGPPDDPTVRVGTATLDRLFERVRQLAQARTRVTQGAGAVQGFALSVRKLRGHLTEALRLIGPPRPWGAPAAAIHRIEGAARELSGLAERLDHKAGRLKEIADGMRIEAAGAHGDLAAMRLTTVAGLFDRVAAAVLAQSRREGLEVALVIEGGETPIDRRVADALFDPVLQLARNAVAHGIEPPAERAARGKPRVGTVRLSAKPRSGGLRVGVMDDGAGVDVVRLRSRAVAAGTISSEMARAADDQTLLALLFVPGFTTRESADLLAGRGVGLDLTLEAVRRLGGTIRLSSEPGMGLSAILDVPLERGLVKVIWIEAGGTPYALPLQHIRRIVRGQDASPAIPLTDCLEGRLDEPARKASSSAVVELDPVAGGDHPRLGVDAVGAIEEVVLRAVSPLVMTAGPYAGAIVRGDELRMCLDALALAELVVSDP